MKHMWTSCPYSNCLSIIHLKLEIWSRVSLALRAPLICVSLWVGLYKFTDRLRKLNSWSMGQSSPQSWVICRLMRHFQCPHSAVHFACLPSIPFLCRSWCGVLSASNFPLPSGRYGRLKSNDWESEHISFLWINEYSWWRKITENVNFQLLISKNIRK